MPKTTMPRLFTTEQAAEYCGLSIANFKYYLREKQVLPDYPPGPRRRGRMLLFTQATLDAFRTQERRPPGRPKRLPED